MGIKTPPNNLSASPLQYSTGTASQSGTTVTGSGTTWTTAMIGSQFVYADGTSSGAITARASNTSVTVTTSQTVTSQGYKIHYQGLQVKSDGNVGIGNSAPLVLLEVGDGGADIPSYMQIASSGNDKGIGIVRNDGKGIYLYSGSEPKLDAFDWSAGGGAIDVIIATNGGNVGIGVTNPDELLEVAGDVKISGTNNLYFYDTGDEHIAADASGVLTITSGATLDLTAPTVDLNSSTKFNIDTAVYDLNASGAVTMNGTTIDIDGSGALSINSSGAAINIGDDDVIAPINIGTGTSVRAITIGNTSGTSSIALKSGTGKTDVTGQMVVDYDIDNTTAATNESALQIDYNRVGDVSSGADINIGVDINATCTGASGGAIRTTGIDVDVNADNAGSGDSTAYGMVLDVNGADENYGLKLIGGGILLQEQGHARADETNFGQIWVKTGNPGGLYFTNEIGTDIVIAAPGDISGLNEHTNISSGRGVLIDHDYSDTDAISTLYSMQIAFDRTGASTSNNTMYGVRVISTSDEAEGGDNTMYGVHSLATLTHATNNGTPIAVGGYFKAVSSSNGLNSKSYGIIIEQAAAGTADINSGLTIQSAANTSDYCSIDVTTEGATTFKTVDQGGAVAHLTLDVDGDILLEPAAGNSILLDGTIDIDAGVVTGATSITSTTFVGALTGNASGTAATVTGAAQTNITSLGTLTALTVDDVAIDGKVITMTGSTGDTFTATVATDGVTTLATTDAGGTAAHLNIEADGHVEFDGCAVGFELETPTYNASDTDVSFVTGNKQFVTFGAGNIADLNLIFPETSGNFVLLLKQDGTGSRTVTNYKAWDLVNSDAADGSATVKFAGGSNPTLTTDANHVDIISFFWDADNQIAYGVASLDFQF